MLRSNVGIESAEASDPLARAIAFYLPQFHAIPENDGWWGPGFTEWTNTRAALPLYRGHQQPRVPADLGYYDLSDASARAAQADLARSHGIEGFCYWHYWFGNGKRMLERPFNQVLESGQPDFPFSLCWANESWTGVWHGAPGRVLLRQEYPGVQDYRDHFETLLPAFCDERYIRIDGKPLFLVYAPSKLPDAQLFCDVFRSAASSAGLAGLFLVGMSNRPTDESLDAFDARLRFGPGDYLELLKPLSKTQRVLRRIAASRKAAVLPDELRAKLGAPLRYDYRKAAESVIRELPDDERVLPSVMSGWDNTPRSGRRGTVFYNYTPEVFSDVLTQAVNYVRNRPPSQRLVFIKAWNEWAEGNMLEPASPYGRAFLEVVRNTILGTEH